MAKEFILPEMGENVESGTVAKVLVQEGEQVSDGQSVLELETDKAVTELPSSVSGTVSELRVKEGQQVKSGDVIFLYEEGGGAEAKPAAEEAAEEPQPEGAGAREAAEEEAPKEKPATEEAPPEPAPKPAKAGKKPEPSPKAEPKVQGPAPTGSTLAPPQKRRGPVLAAPTVRRLAREHGVSLSEVPVSAPEGPVTAEDVLRYVEQKGVGPVEEGAHRGGPFSASAGGAAVATRQQIPDELERGEDQWGPVAHQPMSGIRRKTAQHMANVWQTVPHVTHFEKADITALEQVRKQYGKQVEQAGGKLTVTSFILKVAAAALRKFPQFNANIDLENARLILKAYYNIGIAVDTEHGLLVPVIRDVDQKSLTEISAEMPLLAQKARERKLNMKDMQGGTFTPIINAPEVAILGVSRARVEPVHINGQFSPRLLLPLSISYDHRVIDGADAARFMAWLVSALEQPWALMFE